MKRLIEAAGRYKRRRIIKYLCNTSPVQLESAAIKSLFKALKHAGRQSPAYNEILRKAGIKTDQVKTLNDFTQKIPVLNKENYFKKFTLAQLLGNNLNNMKLAMSSSGYSGSFAFGFSTDKAVRSVKTGVDTTLDYWFGISDHKTFLINCAPMGVHVETSIPVAETSVRSDMAIALLKKVSPFYDQTILGGDPYFLKKLIEEGDEQKIPWEKLNVSLITAQDWLPESLRTYLANRLGFDPDRSEHRNIYATMGMTELGLNVFHESKYTVRMRRLMQYDDTLRTAISGEERKKTIPCIFHYYPFNTFIEEHIANGFAELLFSNVNRNAILPVLRYSTGDRGSLLTYQNLLTILYNNYDHLIPDLKLPLGIIRGRLQNRITVNKHAIYIEDIREGLFGDHEVASNCTGMIRLSDKGNEKSIIVQLRKGCSKNSPLEKKIFNAINSLLPAEMQVKVIEYDEDTDLLELSYEKKFACR